MTEPTYDERMAAQVDAFIASQVCTCERAGDSVYPCHRHQLDDWEHQYAVENDTFVQTIQQRGAVTA